MGQDAGAKDDSAVRTGQTLREGRYRLDRHLASEGTSDVYVATDLQSQSAVTVRLLRDEFALRSADVDSFLALPKALAKLCPPHVARVMEVATDDSGVPMVVEEAVAGQTLAELLMEHPTGLPFADACRVIAPVFEAVARLHMAEVTHGHVDPRRIVMAPHEDGFMPRLTHYNAVIENERAYANYLAPEQRSGEVQLDPAMDVWALGMLTHHVLTGRRPPLNPTTAQLQESLPDLPKSVASALSEALSDDPAERLPDAAVLWMRVETALTPKRVPKQVASSQAAAAPAKPTPAASAPKPVEASPKQAAVSAQSPKRAVISAAAAAFAPLEEEEFALPSSRPGEASLGGTDDAGDDLEASLPAGATPMPRLGGRISLAPDAMVDVAQAAAQATARTRTATNLTHEQMRQIYGLSTGQEEHDAWPWVRLVLLLLLLLLVYKAVPYLTEPDLVAARVVLGNKFTIVGVAFSAVSAVAAFKVWGLFSRANVVLLRPVAYLVTGVALCICVLVGGSMMWSSVDPALLQAGVRAFRSGGGGAAWRVIGGAARAGLPYGTTLMLSLGALGGLMYALRVMGQSLALAVAMMLAAVGGGAASVDLAVKVLKPDVERRVRERKERAERGEDEPVNDIERLKNALGPPKVNVNDTRPRPKVEGEPELRQRTTIGDGDDTTMLMEDMKRQRAHQSDAIKEAGKELPIGTAAP